MPSSEELLKLARQYEMTLAEVELAIAMEEDLAIGEIFEFAEVRIGLGPVPPWDAVVFLPNAMVAAKRDAGICQEIIEELAQTEWGEEEIREMLLVSRNYRDWSLFWSYRDESPKGREQFNTELHHWEIAVGKLERALEGLGVRSVVQ